MPTSTIAASTAWQIGSQLVMAALSAVTVKLVAIGLSRELAGNYHSAYSYLQLFGILADFGLYAISVRELAKTEERSHILSALIALRSIVLCASLLSAITLAWIVPMWRGTPLPLSIAIASLVPFFTLLAGILRTVFQVTYRMEYVFIAEVTQRVVTAGLIGILVLTGVQHTTNFGTYYLFLLIGGIGAFVLFVLSLLFAAQLIPIRLRWDWPLVKKLAGASLPYGLVFLCIALYRQLDLTMIALLRPDYALQNAYYGFANRIVEMTYIVPTYLLNSVLPILGKRHEGGEDVSSLLHKTLLAILILGSTCTLFSLLWATPLIRLLTTPLYLATPLRAGADTALRLLSPSMLLNGLVLFSFYIFITHHTWRRLLKSMSIAVALSIALNLLLIPPFGFIGAGITSNAIHLLLTALLLPEALHLLPARISHRDLGRWLFYSILLAVLLGTTAPLLRSTARTVMGLLAAGTLTLLLLRATGLKRTLMGG